MTNYIDQKTVEEINYLFSLIQGDEKAYLVGQINNALRMVKNDLLDAIAPVETTH